MPPATTYTPRTVLATPVASLGDALPKPPRKNARKCPADKDRSAPPAPPAGQSARPKQHLVNPGALQICDDPLPDDYWSVATPGKYDAKFALLKPGQALRCAIGETPAVAHALRKHLARRNIKHMAVRTVRDYGDGAGRVWLVPDGKGGACE